jgi:hypothetical protein
VLGGAASGVEDHPAPPVYGGASTASSTRPRRSPLRSRRKDWIKKEVEITYDPTDRHLVFYVPQRELRKHLSIKRLSKEGLMGELGPLANLHGFQLALPFTWNEWRVLRLCETLGTTT